MKDVINFYDVKFKIGEADSLLISINPFNSSIKIYLKPGI